MQVTWVRSLGWEYSLEKEMATHSSILAWKIPWTEGIWQATVHKVTKSQTWLNTHTHTHTHIHTPLCQVGSVIPISEMREKRASESRNFRKKFGSLAKNKSSVRAFWNTKVKVVQLCLALCDPMDCSLPGSSVHDISQTRILEWVTLSFSRGKRHLIGYIIYVRKIRLIFWLLCLLLFLLPQL